MYRRPQPLDALCVCYELNKDAGLLHTDEQGGRVCVHSSTKETGLASLCRELSVGDQSPGGKYLVGESYGGHLLHTLSTSAHGPDEDCHLSEL